MTSFRVALLGTGGIYKLAHGPAWRQIPRVRVVATCDIIEERAEEACHEMGAEASFTRFEDLLDNDGFDLVDICTPVSNHAEMAIRALRAGKHVICEKPMALTPEDATRMIQTAAEAKRGLYIGHTRRFDRRWVQVKDHLTAGRIGDPVSVRWSERCRAAFPKGDWRWDPRNGGVVMDVGVHVADLFAWFLDAQPTGVYAKTLSIGEEAREQGCADFGIVQVGFTGRKQGMMEVSWAHPKKYAPFYSTLEIIGTRGKLTLSDRGATPMAVVKNEIAVPRFSTLLSTFPETFIDELNHFLDCIEGKASPRITLADAQTAVRVISSSLESVSTGRAISLSGRSQKC